jgi:hypothetical protein
MDALSRNENTQAITEANEEDEEDEEAEEAAWWPGARPGVQQRPDISKCTVE